MSHWKIAAAQYEPLHTSVTEHVAHHPHRKFIGETRDQVAMTVADKAVDQTIGDLANPRLHGANPLGGQRTRV